MNFLATEYGDQLLVAALDAEENPLTCEQYAIMGLPTLLFFQDGVEIERQVGLLPYEELRQRVAARLNPIAAMG
jgi:thioredoxin 1